MELRPRARLLRVVGETSLSNTLGLLRVFRVLRALRVLRFHRVLEFLGRLGFSGFLVSKAHRLDLEAQAQVPNSTVRRPTVGAEQLKLAMFIFGVYMGFSRFFFRAYEMCRLLRLAGFMGSVIL